MNQENLRQVNENGRTQSYQKIRKLKVSNFKYFLFFHDEFDVIFISLSAHLESNVDPLFDEKLDFTDWP